MGCGSWSNGHELLLGAGSGYGGALVKFVAQSRLRQPRAINEIVSTVNPRSQRLGRGHLIAIVIAFNMGQIFPCRQTRQFWARPATHDWLLCGADFPASSRRNGFSGMTRTASSPLAPVVVATVNVAMPASATACASWYDDNSPESVAVRLS
jgi:hypothetical protein